MLHLFGSIGLIHNLHNIFIQCWCQLLLFFEGVGLLGQNSTLLVDTPIGTEDLEMVWPAGPSDEHGPSDIVQPG